MRVKSRGNWERFGAMRSERREGARAESLTRGGLCFRREVANVTEAVLRWAGLEAGSRLPAGSHFERRSLVSDFTLVSGAREETSEASVDICSRPYTCEVRFRRGVSEDCSLWTAQRESLLGRTGICAGMFQTTRTENSNNSEGECVVRAVE